MLTWIACRAKVNPWITTAGLFAHLGWIHWQRMMNNYLEYTMDISAIAMLMVIKLSSFAFDVYDRRLLNELVSANRRPEVEKTSFTEEEVKRLLSFTEPTLPSYLGYAFLFPGFLCGPVIFYAAYESFCIMPTPQVPFRRRRATRQFSMAIFFGLLYFLMDARYPVDKLVDPRFFEQPILDRLKYLIVANTRSRFMYYTAWMLAEGSLVTMGIGYDPETGRWDGAKIVRPLEIEFSGDIRQVLQNWNISTDRWLHRYFYKRLGRAFGSFGWRADLSVKLVSAFWHGFYPGYFIAFLSVGLLTQTSRSVYRKIQWPLVPWLRPYVTYIPHWLLLNYFCPPFFLLEWQKGIQFYSSWYWYGHIICILSLIILYFVPRSKAYTLKRHPKAD